ncbi:MAG: hypothetical protein MK081_06630 [Flavobacteriales bacterium]|nr:hypothetical protein [Flavobacteriales bacterium]
MANKGGTNNLILIIGGLVVVVGIFYLLFFTSKVYNWSESYDYEEELPYGSYVFREVVEGSHPNTEFIEVADTVYLNVNTDSLPENSNYFLIGRELYLDSAETAFLLDFVERGNQAFVISNAFSDRLLDTLISFPSEYDFDFFSETEELQPITLQAETDTSIAMDLCAPALWDEIPTTSILDSTVECKFVRSHVPQNKNWIYFPYGITAKEDRPIEVVGCYNEGFVNYIRVKYGEGYFYLHSTPLAFTNYQLLKKEGFRYVSEACRYMGDGAILWDEHNRYYQYAPYQGGSSGGSSYDHKEGPLNFILSERGLRWAWFTLIALGVLYMIFGARRKLRAIPVLHAPENTSIDFAETIGTMFRIENDHGKLVRLKMRLFRAHVRERYLLKTAVETKEEENLLIERLSEKTDIPIEEIQTIFNRYHELLTTEDVESKDLITFHQMLERFYQNAR